MHSLKIQLTKPIKPFWRISITTVAGFFSGFKIVNKWSIDDFKCLLLDNGLTVEKLVKIDGRFPLAYVVLKKN
jgi:hypothetical protein